MSTPIYTNDHRRNLTMFWKQYFPSYEIPKGYHVHHIKPRCTFKDKNDARIHHPKNLIALHPDDHYTIHKCRGDKHLSSKFITSVVGRVVSDEIRQKISKSKTGIPRSDETKQKLRNANLGKKHKPHSDETKAKIGKSNRGKIRTQETKNHLSKINTGIVKGPPSDETREKNRQSHLGVKHTQQRKDNISKAKLGNKWYNNGIVTKQFKPGTEEDGFVLGRNIKIGT